MEIAGSQKHGVRRKDIAIDGFAATLADGGFQLLGKDRRKGGGHVLHDQDRRADAVGDWTEKNGQRVRAAGGRRDDEGAGRQGGSRTRAQAGCGRGRRAAHGDNTRAEGDDLVDQVAAVAVDATHGGGLRLGDEIGGAEGEGLHRLVRAGGGERGSHHDLGLRREAAQLRQRG